MNARTNVTLMTPEASVAATVTAALQTNGHVLAGPAVRDIRDLASQLVRAATPIVLIDLDPQPQQLLPQLERLISRFPTTRFVALSTTLGNDLLMDAMQTGIRRVVMKQAIAMELPGVLDRLRSSEGASPRGEVVTILSASGGCGATTLTVNLAEEVALKKKQPTLIVDLDTAYGAVASYLGLSPHYAADHVLHYAGDIDAQLIRSTATSHNERIHVLASPASTNAADAESLRFDRLDHALDSARRAYAMTIVDAPRVPISATSQLVAASAHTLLLLQLTVKDLRTARAMIDSLKSRGIAIDKIIPVANRYVKRQLISLEEGAKALGGIDIVPIRNDFSAASHGWNFGQLLAESGPRSNVRRDIQSLMEQLEARSAVSS